MIKFFSYLTERLTLIFEGYIFTKEKRANLMHQWTIGQYLFPLWLWLYLSIYCWSDNLGINNSIHFPYACRCSESWRLNFLNVRQNILLRNALGFKRYTGLKPLLNEINVNLIMIWICESSEALFYFSNQWNRKYVL